MKNTDKVYEVKINPVINETVLLRVPDGVEINQEILENSWFFEDWYFDSPPILNPNTKLRLELNEVNKELWNGYDSPSLDEDGDIHFDYEGVK